MSTIGGSTVQQLYNFCESYRCGIALDSNLIPVHDEVYREGFDQPVLFINSQLGYQWKENMYNMSRLLRPVHKPGRCVYFYTQIILFNIVPLLFVQVQLLLLLY